MNYSWVWGCGRFDWAGDLSGRASGTPEGEGTDGLGAWLTEILRRAFQDSSQAGNLGQTPQPPRASTRRGKMTPVLQVLLMITELIPVDVYRVFPLG